MKKLADAVSAWLGTASALWATIAVTVITGLPFRFGASWRDWFNTVVGGLTLLLLVPMTAAQRRHEKAMHAKEDELLRATEGAREELQRAEDCDEDEIDAKRT